MRFNGPSLSAKAWLSSRPPAASLPYGSPAVEVHSSGDGRGLGLFVIRPVPKHHLILADPAMILMSPFDDLPELYTQFVALPNDAKDRYLSLGSAENPERDALLAEKLRLRDLYKTHGEDGILQMTKVAGIMQTNAFNVDVGDGLGSRHRALFPTLARANHSCMPNAHVCFYPPGNASGSKGRMFVHTLRPLEAGEEVLISYFDILLPRSDRRERTRKWGFQCHCTVCDEDESATDGVSLEDQRQFLRDWLRFQAQAVGSSKTSSEQLTTAIEIGQQLIRNAEVNASLTPAFPNMHDALAMLQAKLVLSGRDDDRSGILASLEKSAIWEANLTGSESPATIKRLMKLKEFARNKDKAVRPTIGKDERGHNIVRWDT